MRAMTTTTASDGARAVGCHQCRGGIDNDNDTVMAMKMTPWRAEEQ